LKYFARTYPKGEEPLITTTHQSAEHIEARALFVALGKQPLA
jgi:hypothetical protein